MPIHGAGPSSRRKIRNPKINHADPLSPAVGETSSGESSIQNGNGAAKGTGGPRTEQGKNRSSRNAVKHAIFCAVVLPEESSRMYREIFHAFCDYIKPNDRVEQILVEKLAANIWRSKRLIVAESADVHYTSNRARMECMLAGRRSRRKQLKIR
jgi:hypothetical protein